MYNPTDPRDQQQLAASLAAYEVLMNEVATETQYHLLGKREDPEKVAYLGNIIERAAARRREQERLADR